MNGLKVTNIFNNHWWLHYCRKNFLYWLPASYQHHPSVRVPTIHVHWCDKWIIQCQFYGLVQSLFDHRQQFVVPHSFIPVLFSTEINSLFSVWRIFILRQSNSSSALFLATVAPTENFCLPPVGNNTSLTSISELSWASLLAESKQLVVEGRP